MKDDTQSVQYLQIALDQARERIAELEESVSRGAQTGQDLRESEQAFRSLFENMFHGVAYCKMLFEHGRPVDFICLKVNKALGTLLGLEDITGKKVSEAFPGILQSDPQIFEILGNAVITGEPRKFETYIEALRQWFTISVYSPGQEYFVIIFDVITERKAAEEALRASEAFRRRVFEGSHVPMVVMDVQTWRYIDCNQAAVDIYQFDSIEATLGKTPLDVSAPVQYDGTPSSEKARYYIERGCAQGSIIYEWLHQRPSGERWDAQVHLMSFKDGMRELLQFTLQDITRHKQAKEEKTRLQEQLLQAQKMESAGRLAGGMAHDLNNKLTAILGHTELAFMKCTQHDPIYMDLKIIEESAMHAADLIKKLLGFARRQTVAPKVLDLNDTITGILMMLRRSIGEDIDLVWAPGADLWPVKIDPSQIDQILMNLCMNSRDAITGMGKISIETTNKILDEDSCRQSEGLIPGSYVMLGVCDTGSGMNKETLATIFEPFFTTKAVGQGTGLGLSTVYGIVKQNNGCIHVYSEPGKGTCFKIYFQREEEEIKVQKPKAPTEIPLGFGETILLVEDNPATLNISRMMLERLGYAVLCASRPEEAVALSQTHAGNIALLFTDIVMPGMGGRDLAHRIKALNPGIRCLFSSGYPVDIMAGRGIVDEGVSFIPKPYTLMELAMAVRQALQ